MKSCAVVFAVLTLAAGSALAARPGKVWDMKMEMPGMPMAMPAQQVCVPDGTPAASAPNDPKCQILDQKQSGNRYQWKANCPDGVMEADFTAGPNGYNGTMKSTTQGQTMTVNVAGTNTGKACQAPY